MDPAWRDSVGIPALDPLYVPQSTTLLLAILAMARMAALTASGNVGQAAITTSRSGQISRLSGETAALSAALGNSLDKVEFAKRLAAKEFEGSWT